MQRNMSSYRLLYLKMDTYWSIYALNLTFFLYSVGRDTVSALEWQYFQTKQRSGKRLKINGETMMTVELNQITDSQILMLESTQAMLNVSESRISMMPSGLFSSVILDKTSIGLPKTWRWGDLETNFEYDRHNR